MGAVTGLLSDVPSWTGTFNAAVLALLKPMEFTLNHPGDNLDTTGFASGALAVASKIKGLRQWSGSLRAYLATPANGITGAVSGASYTANVRSWEMNLKAGALDATAWPVTSGNWRTFLPGLIEWSGQYEALVDSSTAVSETSASGEPLTATFTVATGQTLAGSIFTTSAEIVARRGELVTVRYQYQGSGHVTSVGSANIIPAASTLATPVAGTLLLKMAEEGASDKTASGSAFWTGISIKVAPGSVSECVINFQGSDALAFA